MDIQSLKQRLKTKNKVKIVKIVVKDLTSSFGIVYLSGLQK